MKRDGEKKERGDEQRVFPATNYRKSRTPVSMIFV